MEFCGSSLSAIDVILDELPQDVKILDLHSMEPFSTPDQPQLAPDNLRAFLGAYKTRELNDRTRRPVDIIVGTKRPSAPIADMEMSRALAELLGSAGMLVGYNNPYDTGPKYSDFYYMKKYPGRVSAVDFRKTDLCKGSGEDRSFDTTCPV